jgi:hypothetical protein
MFNYIKYIGLITIVAASYKVEGAIELASFILAALAIIFYALSFQVFAGISKTSILKDFDVLRMITVYMINVTMMIGVFMSPYSYVAIFALPWIMIQTMINTLSLLVKYDIVGIRESDED